MTLLFASLTLCAWTTFAFAAGYATGFDVGRKIR